MVVSNGCPWHSLILNQFIRPCVGLFQRQNGYQQEKGHQVARTGQRDGIAQPKGKGVLPKETKKDERRSPDSWFDFFRPLLFFSAKAQVIVNFWAVKSQIR